MDFKRLGYFLRVAELGSLSRAGERLHIAQPSLSRQMRLLEEELGVTLFTRGGRGMQLTEAGEELRLRITGPLRQVGHALNEVRAMPSETAGAVVFGMPATTVSILGGALARRLAAAHPNIALQIVDGHSGHLLDLLQRGQLDAAILYGPTTPGGLNATKLLEDELLLVGPAEAALRPDQPVEFATLAGLPLLLPGAIHGRRITLEAAATKAKVRLNVRMQLDSLQLTKDFVEAGQGYTLLPLPAFSREVARGQLTYTSVANPRLSRVLYMAMQPASQSVRSVLQLEDFLRQELNALATDGRWPVLRLFDIGDL